MWYSTVCYGFTAAQCRGRHGVFPAGWRMGVIQRIFTSVNIQQNDLFEHELLKEEGGAFCGSLHPVHVSFLTSMVVETAASMVCGYVACLIMLPTQLLRLLPANIKRLLVQTAPGPKCETHGPNLTVLTLTFASSPCAACIQTFLARLKGNKPGPTDDNF